MQKKTHSIDIVFVLILFTVFSLSALSIVYIGAHVYDSSTKTTDEINNFDLGMNYIVEKIKIHNNGSISVQKKDNYDILTFLTSQNQIHYMYAYNGFLCEYSADQNEPFDFKKGKHVIAMQQLKLTLHRYQLKIQVVIKNHGNESYINLVRSDIE